MKTLWFCLLLQIFSLTVQAEESMAFAKKKIFFIGTGGTIAGLAQNPSDPSYDPGQVTIQAILKAVPDIQKLADINGQQLIDRLKLQELIQSGMSEAEALKRPEVYVNTCSCNLNEYHWRLLAERINRALNQEAYDAVIVTHGTDTIEETAFFLEMTVRSSKPVILVGAARPANHPEADGPDNIRQAVRVAIDSKANGKGVMLVMHGSIWPGFNVTENKATMPSDPIVNRFSSPHFGKLGRVLQNRWVEWDTTNRLNRYNIRSLKFTTTPTKALPKVPILLQYVGNDSVDLYRMYRTQGVRAFVIDGFGVSSTANDFKAIIKDSALGANDSIFVSGSRTKEALADNFLSYDVNAPLRGLVYSGTLTPYEAKIFLQLVLAGLDEGQSELMDVIRALPATATLREKVRAIYTEFLYRRLGFPARTE